MRWSAAISVKSHDQSIFPIMIIIRPPRLILETVFPVKGNGRQVAGPDLEPGGFHSAAERPVKDMFQQMPRNSLAAKILRSRKILNLKFIGDQP